MAYNPADFLIGVLAKSNEVDGMRNASKLCDAYDAINRNNHRSDFENFDGIEDSKYDVQKPFWIFTLYWLIYRNLLIVLRDPSIQRIRILQKVVSYRIT